MRGLAWARLHCRRLNADFETQPTPKRTRRHQHGPEDPLARAGAKKRPFYHIVVADSRSPRDGRFIEKLGTYNPMLAEGPRRPRGAQDRAHQALAVGRRAAVRPRGSASSADVGLGREAGDPASSRRSRAPKTKAQERAKAAGAAAGEAARLTRRRRRKAREPWATRRILVGADRRRARRARRGARSRASPTIPRAIGRLRPARATRAARGASRSRVRGEATGLVIARLDGVADRDGPRRSRGSGSTSPRDSLPTPRRANSTSPT